jgi:hypothetical protein
MAGFEVVVRPAVFPNIRPNPPRVLPPPDSPDQGVFTFSGGGGTFVGISYSMSVSISRSKPKQETARQSYRERVHQVDDKGNINKENYIDVERLKKVRMDDEESATKYIYTDPPQADNVETIATDVARKS